MHVGSIPGLLCKICGCEAPWDQPNNELSKIIIRTIMSRPCGFWFWLLRPLLGLVTKLVLAPLDPSAGGWPEFVYKLRRVSVFRLTESFPTRSTVIFGLCFLSSRLLLLSSSPFVVTKSQSMRIYRICFTYRDESVILRCSVVEPYFALTSLCSLFPCLSTSALWFQWLFLRNYNSFQMCSVWMIMPESSSGICHMLSKQEPLFFIYLKGNNKKSKLLICGWVVALNPDGPITEDVVSSFKNPHQGVSVWGFRYDVPRMSWSLY